MPMTMARPLALVCGWSSSMWLRQCLDRVTVCKYCLIINPIILSTCGGSWREPPAVVSRRWLPAARALAPGGRPGRRNRVRRRGAARSRRQSRAHRYPLSRPCRWQHAVAPPPRRLHVMTHIMVLPMRNVFLTAKMVGTVAAMFPGRVHLGVGVGWMPEEFALLDSDFHTRGARTEEMVAVLRALWGEQPASFSGKHHSFESVAMFPVPSVPVPIYGSGSSEAALDRAARVMDGFVAMPCSVDEIENDLMPALRARLGRYGRSISDFHVNVIPAQVGPDDLRRLADLGVTSVQVHPFARDQALHAPLPDKLDAVRRWADRVLTGREPQDEA